MHNQSWARTGHTWAKAGLLLGALALPGCTFKDTSNDKPAGSNSIEDRESAPPTGTPENPGTPPGTP
jgi:hypothetical protein